MSKVPKDIKRETSAGSITEESDWSKNSLIDLDPRTVPTSELEHSFERLTLLYELANQIHSQKDVDKVFQTVLSAVVQLLNTERAFIATRTNGNLIPRVKYNIDLPPKSQEWPVSATMIRRSMDEGLVILTSDATSDDKYQNVPSVDRHSIRSVMCCPLRIKNDAMGIIYIDNRFSTKAFTRTDREFLIALSHFASVAIVNAEERHRLTLAKELAEAQLSAAGEGLSAGTELIGRSSALEVVLRLAKKVAATDVTILLFGETGTGKEVFARTIHSWSRRANKIFQALNLRTLPSNLIESELFGHVRGAFTGAEKDRVGWLELASGGTLFLDDIQDIPADVQAKMLRVLEERIIVPVGSSKQVEIDVRIISATNRNLEELVKEGSFREDLMYRLNTVLLELPPLRDRKDDIPLLAEHFLQKSGSEKSFDTESLSYLREFQWPGNIRQLKSCVEGLVATSDETVIHATDLHRSITSGSTQISTSGSFEPLKALIGRIEKLHIVRAIELANGNFDEAIRILGIARATFYNRLKRYNIRDI